MLNRNALATTKRLANIREHLIAYAQQMDSLESEYHSLIEELEQSFIDSKAHWEKAVTEEKEAENRYAATALQSVEKMAKGLEALDGQLSQIDQSYAKRRDILLLQIVPAIELRTVEDIIARMQFVAERARTIASECSLSVKAQPIQELTMLFSGKRKQLYEELSKLLVEGKALKDKASSLVQQRLSDNTIKLDEKKEKEIEKAAEETAMVISATEETYSARTAEVRQYYESLIANIFTRDELEALVVVRDSLKDMGILPDQFNEYIDIGNYETFLGDVAYSGYVLSIVNKLYYGFIEGQYLTIPAIVDLREESAFLFEVPGESAEVQHVVNSLMFSLISSQPAPYQKFVLYDPEGRSRGFAPFMEFMKNNPSVMYDQVFTTQHQIRNQLEKLSAYIDKFNQTQIADGTDIFSYNRISAERPQVLNCVCLLNFPKGFDEQMLEPLDNIVRNGSACGIQTLIHFDEKGLRETSSTSYLDLLKRIRQHSICMELRSNRWSTGEGVSWNFKGYPSADIMQGFSTVFSEKVSDVSSAILPITKVVPEARWFAGDSAPLLSIPIGKAESGKIQNLEFGDPVSDGTSHHALVTGSLGSGKSTLLHTIIMSALTTYAPDELNLYLLDFKSGTEFQIYSNYKIPHIIVLALDAMQEFGLSVMRELYSIAQSRLELFNEETTKRGLPVKDITSYRKYTGEKMPRILVVADEFQVLFSEAHNRRVAAECATYLADNISLYRVCGIHFVLATQTLSRLRSGFSVSLSTLNEMHVRIGLKCSEPECALLFGDNNSSSSFEKMGEIKGTGVYDKNYVIDKPVGFKVAFCDSDTQTSILEAIQERYGSAYGETNTKIFVGDDIPNLRDCLQYREFDPEESFSSVPIYLGDPIRIADPVTINVSRMKRSTLLLVGSERKMTDRIIAVYISNAVKSQPHKMIKATETSVYLLDGLSMMGEPYSEKVGNVVRNASSDIKCAKDVFEVLPFIDELYDIYEERKKKRMSLGRQKAQYNTIHVVINDFQWIEPVSLMLHNKSVDDFIMCDDTEEKTSGDELFGYLGKSSKPKTHANDLTDEMDSFMAEIASPKTKRGSNISYNKKVMNLIESGYTCGINVVMSCPDLISIKEIIYECIPKFQNKIIYALSDKDADRIIPEAKVEKLKSNIALFYDGVNPAYQFKPFDIK